MTLTQLRNTEFSKLTPKQKRRFLELERECREVDVLTEVFDNGDAYVGIATLWDSSPVLRDEFGQDVTPEGQHMRINCRHYVVPNGVGMLADVVKCLRQFAADLIGAADAAEAQFAYSEEMARQRGEVAA